VQANDEAKKREKINNICFINNKRFQQHGKRNLSLHGSNFVGANSRTKPVGDSFTAINPKTNENIQPTFFTASESDIERSVHMAENAFLKYKEVKK